MDKKAKRILFSTYWKNGWIDAKNRSLSEPDFSYAKSKGLMFDPLTISHDECIVAITALVKGISQTQVTKGFLSSLTSRRLDWRSSIASYAIAQKIPYHHYTPVISGTSYTDGEPTAHSYTCGICRDSQYGIRGSVSYNEMDINVFNFERIKWGGVRHGDILYTYFDLSQFINADIPQPTADDIACFREILTIIETSDPSDYPSALEKRLASVIKSSKAERQILIEILASLGILKHRCFDRQRKGKNDWVFAEYWRGEDKYCQQTVDRLFGEYLTR
ncbi:hypothetical protein HRJ35_12140 [Shewanella oneidensis MR-1]|uniref:Uncharacterized protein n=1 Tax=Shewanella oneidensis (strain ATCC 700550 / JCM 31522 / CIP 106686 / LMG 19005 / NCIMB 14063 / MR-1) TaxID=211586 RepID=Q8EFA9_SHEON|nr:hypothetical protein [Shewanella oneidensis]AAN55122.1 uncharacterized protein SO_2075 [Shewanella oneidensis MR-1]MDX5996186.1 hypothetical protein [Shewanella oneidensis]MEE2029922.1 hypothetical protein [Shewanella oneidensis]QKG96690.1 hypothetical protein HRJ35_12140 [Shewanella oneidensis MR-1]